MEFFDDAVNKAKEAIDVACKKTNEVVTVQKQKFDISALETKRTKDFQVLGEIYYNKIKSGEAEDGGAAELVASIDAKNERIRESRDEINNIKNKRICPKCGTAVDKCSNYCNACGAKLVFDSEEETPQDENTEE